MASPVEKGQILAGKYRVERVLGEGGMGVVVAATDTQLERMVAIKFLLPEYAEHGEAGMRFMREARAAVKIQSEHIARVIDVNEMDNGSPYMVMEYLQGGDLSQVLEKTGPMPVEDAVSYVIQACDAIAEAHSYGIVHRDLKPANLFLAKQADGSSKVKVLDFGISKNTFGAADGTDPSLTRTSSMMGSPLYMSPEQMRSTKDVDSRTDVWALGVILYELLTARLPFDANSIPELSAKILLEDPDPITRVDVPKALQKAIERSLEKKAVDRFPSVAEFSIAIARFAPKRARANVERISRILTAAGMSDSHLHLPPSLPPVTAAALDATRIDGGGEQILETRAHSATVGQWGRTSGPERTEKKSIGARVWITAAAISVAVVGGGAYFGTAGSGAAAPAAVTDPGADLATGRVAEAAGAAAAVVPADPPTSAPSAAPAPVSREPAVGATTAAAATAAAPPAQVATPKPVPKVVAAPTPKPKSKPRAQSPATRKKSPAPPPLKDKFGSRK
jgi:serine/threonine-protein kinase